MSDTETTPRAKRRPYRRQQILEAAVTLFAEHGYHATGMNDIGAIVGISGPGIYRHFASKEAILEAAIEDAAERLLHQVELIVEQHDDPLERLEALVAHAVRNVLANHELYATAITERRNLSEAAQELFVRSTRLRVEEWTLPLRQLRPELSQSEARFLVGITQAMIISDEPLDVDVDPDQLLRGLYDVAMCVLLGEDELEA